MWRPELRKKDGDQREGNGELATIEGLLGRFLVQGCKGRRDASFGSLGKAWGGLWRRSHVEEGAVVKVTVKQPRPLVLLLCIVKEKKKRESAGGAREGDAV
jgi:hypothetical protein